MIPSATVLAVCSVGAALFGVGVVLVRAMRAWSAVNAGLSAEIAALRLELVETRGALQLEIRDKITEVSDRLQSELARHRGSCQALRAGEASP